MNKQTIASQEPNKHTTDLDNDFAALGRQLVTMIEKHVVTPSTLRMLRSFMEGFCDAFPLVMDAEQAEREQGADTPLDANEMPNEFPYPWMFRDAKPPKKKRPQKK